MTRAGESELSEADWGHIIALRKEGYIYCDIAERIGVSPSCVYKTVQRYNKYGTYKSLPRSGRPCTLSPRTECLVLRNLRLHQFEPYKDIAKWVEGVSRHQVQDLANEHGYHHWAACKKPYLRGPTLSKRHIWMKENTGRDWDGVMWSDESTMEPGGTPGT
ncbi:DNA-directed RNA polymerase I subunit RPA2, partial [Ceratobasidium sp. 370]